VIRARVDFLQGLEKKQRRDPKAYPKNNPEDVEAADAMTEGLRYAMRKAKYLTARSAAWKNVTVEGYGGVELFLKRNRKGDVDIGIAPVPWDRIIFDPHSARPDFSDASYVGTVVWKDYADAVAKYDAQGIDVRDKLDVAIEATSLGQTWDDKPKRTVWADPRRKRVRIVHLWCRHPSGWVYYEFTKGGILDWMQSPYVDEDGESFCPLILESCYVDRDNNRYGIVRDLIDPQDEINKRRSKSLHLLSTQSVVAEEGAVANVAEAKREIAKPDGWITKRPGTQLDIQRNTDLAAGQAQMMGTAMAYVNQHGPNQALLGKGTEDQSGRAIEAQQAGGLIEQGDLLDTLTRMDDRVFTAAANMLKQAWTAEKWIRVTDDELAPRWIGLNIQEPVTRTFQDPQTGEVMQQTLMDPYTGQPVTRLRNNIGELEIDLEIGDAPLVLSLDGENYQSFTQLLQGNLPPPLLKLAVEMHPGLSAKRKKQVIDLLDQMTAQPQQPSEPSPADQLALETGAAKVEEIRARTEKTKADGAFAAARADATTRRAINPPPVAQAPVSAF
jgi:hypothetical protein